METKNYKELPFDLETAMKHPGWVYTRIGRKARIVCTDRKDYRSQPIIALVDYEDREIPYYYREDGFYYVSADGQCDLDLILHEPTTIVKKWAVSYIEEETRCMELYLYDSYEEAKRCVTGLHPKDNTWQIHEIEVEEQ